MNTTTLSIGDLRLAVPHRAASEVAFIYREIYEQHAYLKHGISVGPGDVVLDVGANVGLFSLYLAERCKVARVIAFEPTPPIYACARENLAAYPNVEVRELGLGAAESAREILYFPRAPGNSTLHEADKREECERMSRGFRMSDVWGASKLHAALLSLLFPLRRKILRSYFDGRFREGIRYQCRVTTLDCALDEAQVGEVALLKVDVEGAEVDVFRGLSDENLARIRQVAVEVSPKHKAWIATLHARFARSGFAHVRIESVVPRSDYRTDVYPCVVFARR